MFIKAGAESDWAFVYFHVITIKLIGRKKRQGGCNDQLDSVFVYMAIDYLIMSKKVISNTYYGHGTDMDYFYPFKRHAKVTRMGILTSVSSHEEAIFRLNTRHYSHGISMYPPRQSTNLLVLSSPNTFLGSVENAVKTEISKKQLVL